MLRYFELNKNEGHSIPAIGEDFRVGPNVGSCFYLVNCGDGRFIAGMLCPEPDEAYETECEKRASLESLGGNWW